MTTSATGDRATVDVKQQAGMLLEQAAGYVATRTIQLGLRTGLLEVFADADGGITPDELAVAADIDPFYAQVWCRAATAAGLLKGDGARLRLAEHLDDLLLTGDHPAHVGAVFRIFEHPEIFEHFGERLATGERTWWDRCSPEFIAGVSATGLPFYVRLIPGGLNLVPGLAAQLQGPARILDAACGAGAGLVRLAEAFPTATLVGADGDRHSLQRAARALAEAGIDDRVELVHTPLEELNRPAEFDLVINNISMHECRDIDRVTARMHQALRPGGWFVISDFPFPDDDDGLRSPPGRIMSGIQFFEAQIDDQLLPRHTYDHLLTGHGFADLGSAQLTPMHALTWGRRAQGAGQPQADRRSSEG
jgi:SAM-dependent methyltransferase